MKIIYICFKACLGLRKRFFTRMELPGAFAPWTGVASILWIIPSLIVISVPKRLTRVYGEVDLFYS